MYNQYYVYFHRSSDGRIIYCGVGTQGRAYEQTKRDSYHKKLITSYTHDYVELVATHLTKAEAIQIERKHIREEDPECNIQERIK